MGVFGVVFGRRGDGGFTLVCISGCRGVIGFNVTPSQVPVHEKVRPARPGADASAKKFAQRTKNGPQSAACGVLGEVFRENTAGGVVLGEVFRGTAAEQSVLGEFCRTTTQVRPLLGYLRLGSNRKAACWERHRRMGMKKALPKECLVEMQNPHRWIAPRGAAARPEGLEPPTF